VSATKSGFVSVQYGQLRPFESGKAIDLIDGQVMDKADIAMPRGSVISGRIVDEFGEPIAEVPVLHGHAGLTPVNSPVHSQQAELAGRLHDASDEGDAADETAEVVEENAELPVQPVEARAQMYVVPAAPAPVAHRASRPRSAPGSKGKAAFTLRLDPERHLKLRLACAVSGRSAQLLVTDALDQFLDGMPELEAMAQKAKRKG
jgi:hypothetical protein